MEIPTIIGVDLGGTNVRAGRVEGGIISSHSQRSVSSKASSDRVMEDIYTTIEEVMAPDVEGIGIGVPSIVDVERGIVYTVKNIPCWKEVHLKELIERRYGIPAYINNDANCFALGEFFFGQGRGFRHMVGLIVGTGMGAGLVLDGRLYSGTNCGAGEVGKIAFKDGTLEQYASGSRFPRLHALKGEVVHQMAVQGNPDALRIYSQFGEDFGHAMMTVLYAFDPELIVLGGSVSKGYAFFEAAMRAKLKSFSYQHVLERLQIRVTENPQIAILGAAALCLDALTRSKV